MYKKNKIYLLNFIILYLTVLCYIYFPLPNSKYQVNYFQHVSLHNLLYQML